MRAWQMHAQNGLENAEVLAQERGVRLRARERWSRDGPA